MSSPKIIQLRQALAEKFPHLRSHWDKSGVSPADAWATGWQPIDESLWRGLPKGALTELIAAPQTTGSATLVRALMERAAREQRIITLVDGNDTLDVTQFDAPTLTRLLWIRSRSAEEALKALDVVLRDANLGFVIVDLVSNAAAQLRRIPGTVWYRFQRLVENTSAICVVVTPRRMVLPAQLQITLHSQFSLTALEQDADDLLAGVKAEIAMPAGVEDVVEEIA